MNRSSATIIARDLYESGRYVESNPDWHAGEAEWKACAIADMLCRHEIKPKSIVDVGCGTGDVLVHLQRELPAGTRLTGYDIAPLAIGMAGQKGNANLGFKLGEPPTCGHYDVLLILDVMEHIENAEGWLRSMRGRARYTIFHIPLDLTTHRILRPDALRNIRHRYGHLHFYNRELAKDVVASAGFEIVDCRYTEEFRVGSREGRKARLLSYCRRLAFAISPNLSVRVMGGCRLLILAK